MFGKLKDKLKGALSLFSKKAEEEAEVKEEIIEKEVETPEDIFEQAGKSSRTKVDPVKEEAKSSKKEAQLEKLAQEHDEDMDEPEKKVEHEKELVGKVTKPSEEVEQKRPSAEELVAKTKKEFGDEKPKEKKPILAEDIVSDLKQEVPQVKNVPKIESNKPNQTEVKEKETDSGSELEIIHEDKKEKRGFFGRIKDSLFHSEEDEIDKSLEESQVDRPKPQEEPRESGETVVKKKSEVKEPTKATPTETPAIEAKKLLVTEDKVEPPEEPEIATKSFFAKIKQTITTKTISADKFENLFWDLEVALLENNVSVEVIERIKDDLRGELVNKPLPRDVPKKIMETLKGTLKDILSIKKIDILQQVDAKKPFIIAFFGINGAGKTTSIAKLAKYFQKNNHSVVLAACDTFRAAAIQQLEEHADKLGVKIIKHDYGSDAAAVAFDAVRYAEKNKVDVVLIDTAGRLHSNTNLMLELEKILRVTKPDLNIFVGESITGNDCIEQARKFNELVDLDGVILTKADVDEKGGAPLSIAYTIKKPILFLGMGQEYKDLEEFDADVILARLGL
jgi:fused signal recognition particle receptor